MARLLKIDPNVFKRALKRIEERHNQGSGCCLAIYESCNLGQNTHKYKQFFIKANPRHKYSAGFWWKFNARGLAARKRALLRAYNEAIKHERKRKRALKCSRA